MYFLKGEFIWVLHMGGGGLICPYFYVHLTIFTSKEKALFQESGSWWRITTGKVLKQRPE